MNSAITFTFLGTGTSVGVPMIGCDCAVCTSSDPRNNRTRCSLHIQTPTVSVLVDSGPDLREQALREGLHTIDAVLYTHSHVDHVAGFDELRAFCWKRVEPLPLYASSHCLNALAEMFPWAFTSSALKNMGYVRPDPRPISEAFQLGELTITPLSVCHGNVHTYGYRFDLPDGQKIAYLPDVKSIPETTQQLLKNVDTLILDALRPSGHITHLSLDEAFELVAILAPRHTYFTHCAHDVDFEKASETLPSGTSLAYDGLALTFPIS